MTRYFSRRCLFAIALAIPVLASGCGASSTSLSGTVTLAGKPLEGGTLIVIASDGAAYNTTIDAEGKYTFDSIPTGEAKVGVVGTNTVVEGKPPPSGGGRGGSGDLARGHGGGGNTPAPKSAGPNGSVVPDGYRDPMTSNLTVVIKKGEKLEIVLP